MKIFLVSILCSFSTFCVFAQKPEFSIPNKVHKFEKIQEGDVVEHVFTITNTGKESLYISDYEVQCSCTEVWLPTGEIQPGETGEIKMRFDSNGKKGLQDRTILLHIYDRKKPVELRFIVKVEEKKEK